MLYMMEWKLRTGFVGNAWQKFLTTGGPFDGVEMIGRYHAPGSTKGWIIVKTAELSAIARFATDWSEFIEWETTPVLEDDAAGEAAAAVIDISEA